MSNITDDALSSQFDAERTANTRILAYVRLTLVSIFFAVHLLLGWGFGIESNRGKEIVFLLYLVVALLLLIAANRKQTFGGVVTYALPLIDVPCAYLILYQWSSAWSGIAAPITQASIGLLALSFMMLVTQLAGFYFSTRYTLMTGFVGMIAMIVLANEGNVPRDSIIFGVFLMASTCFVGHYLTKRFKALVVRFHDEQSNREKMSRYFSPVVVDFLTSGKEINREGKEMDVTVLFVDIRDYTRITENMSGHEVVRLLNSVHERLVKCIFDSGGTLDKYIGDGLMAYFGAPIADSGHADKAVECAEQMKQAIAELNKSRAANSEAPLNIGIGLHSGVAVVGDVGAEFRREYTVIGDTVNTASRVEALTKKHSIDVLATEAVFNRLSNPKKLTFVAEDVVRGRSTSVRTYTLANLSSI
ncbi:MAG: hypothetical protein RI953_2191 [Pseudomonadota bacterium]